VGGLFGTIAESLAGGQDLPAQYLTQFTHTAQSAAGAIRLGAAGSALALVLIGGLVFLFARGRIEGRVLALALPLLVGADLWRAGKDFWMYEDAPTRSLFASDTVTRMLMKEKAPYRVLDPSAVPGAGVYPGATLMAFGIPNVLGHHGNELDAFDKVMGGQDEWTNVSSPGIWSLYAAKYVILPAARSPDSIPGYRVALKNVPTSTGANATVFEANNPLPYARLVPAAVKAPQPAAINALVNSRFNLDGLATLDSSAPITPAAVTQVPPALGVQANVTSWAPGRMTIQLQPAAPQAAYLVVSENWYPDWTAQVDGKPAQVVRGDVSLITVPVPAGAKEVSLVFISKDYATGKAVTFISCLVALAGLVAPPVLRRRTATSG